MGTGMLMEVEQGNGGVGEGKGFSKFGALLTANVPLYFRLYILFNALIGTLDCVSRLIYMW